MRNPLLNFRPGAKSIQVINEIAPEIYDLLLLQEKKLQFLPTKQEEEPDKESSSEEEDPNLTEEEQKYYYPHQKKPMTNVNIISLYKLTSIQWNFKNV